MKNVTCWMELTVAADDADIYLYIYAGNNFDTLYVVRSCCPTISVDLIHRNMLTVVMGLYVAMK